MAKSLFWVWLPVAIWSAIIGLESSSGSAANTQPILEAVLTAIFGEIDPARFAWLHFALRKGGHFAGYGIFAFLWFRAFAATLPKSGGFVWAGLAVVFTALVASLDEWHQSFSAARQGHFGDVVLDSCGAVLLVSLALVMMKRPGRDAGPVRFGGAASSTIPSSPSGS